MAELLLVGALLAAAAIGWYLTRDLAPLAMDEDAGPAAPVPWPMPVSVRVSVVVPARDEEASLPRLLASLRDQTVPVAEVVVVNDASRDRTAVVAAELGATVVAAGTPPVGWTGKAWACHTGAEATGGELLLFLDADTELAPDALARLLQVHHDHGGLVSVQPFHRVERPYENLSAYFNVVAVMASGAFARRAASRPTAFGPCLLTRRDDYRRVGGHGAVRGAILDDVELAAAYGRTGLPVRCLTGGRGLAMRSYPGGPRQLAAGWTKNIASGAAAADPRASLGAVAWICAHHAVAVGAVTGLVAAATSGAAWSHGHLAVWLAAWAALAWQLGRLLRRLGSFRWWTWALFPVPLLAFDALFARSAAVTLVRRSVRWRGRVVDLRRDTTSEGTS